MFMGADCVDEEMECMLGMLKMENEMLQRDVYYYQEETKRLKEHINTLMMESSVLLEKSSHTQHVCRSERKIMRMAKALFYHEKKSDATLTSELLLKLKQAGLLEADTKNIPYSYLKTYIDSCFENLDDKARLSYKQRVIEDLNKNTSITFKMEP